MVWPDLAEARRRARSSAARRSSTNSHEITERAINDLISDLVIADTMLADKCCWELPWSPEVTTPVGPDSRQVLMVHSKPLPTGTSVLDAPFRLRTCRTKSASSDRWVSALSVRTDPPRRRRGQTTSKYERVCALSASRNAR